MPDSIMLYPDTVASLQASINQAGAGGHLRFMPGTYNITSALTPLAGQTWEGKGAVLQKGAGSSQMIVYCGGLTGVTFDSLVFDGNAGAGGYQNSTTLLSVENGCKNVRVKGCDFKNTLASFAGLNMGADSGMRFKDSSFCSATDIYVENVGYGVNIGSDSNGAGGASHHCSVNGIRALGVSANVVFVTGSLDSSTANPTTQVYGHSVANVVADKFADTAVEIGVGCNNVVVSNVTADGEGYGDNVILVRDNKGTSVTNVTGRNLRPDANTAGAGYLLRLFYFGKYEIQRFSGSNLTPLDGLNSFPIRAEHCQGFRLQNFYGPLNLDATVVQRNIMSL